MDETVCIRCQRWCTCSLIRRAKCRIWWRILHWELLLCTFAPFTSLFRMGRRKSWQNLYRCWKRWSRIGKRVYSTCVAGKVLVDGLLYFPAVSLAIFLANFFLCGDCSRHEDCINSIFSSAITDAQRNCCCKENWLFSTVLALTAVTPVFLVSPLLSKCVQFLEIS